MQLICGYAGMHANDDSRSNVTVYANDVSPQQCTTSATWRWVISLCIISIRVGCVYARNMKHSWGRAKQVSAMMECYILQCRHVDSSCKLRPHCSWRWYDVDMDAARHQKRCISVYSRRNSTNKDRCNKDSYQTHFTVAGNQPQPQQT
jgi:hypothetical protein